MPNPLLGSRRNTSRTNVDRPVAIEPAVEEYEGDNLPYRGVVDHGVSGSVDFRETSEDMPDHDGRQVAVYEVPEDGPEPVPVRVVNSSRVERRAFRVITAYATAGSGASGRMILDQDESRIQATIRNPGGGQHIHLSDVPHGCTADFGYSVLSGSSYVTQSQEAIYAAAPLAANDQLIQIAIEYRVSLDD